MKRRDAIAERAVAPSDVGGGPTVDDVMWQHDLLREGIPLMRQYHVERGCKCGFPASVHPESDPLPLCDIAKWLIKAEAEETK